MCIWEGGAPAPLPPLFSQEFCHPTEEYNETTLTFGINAFS
jgi:hypothetical protein